MTVVSHSQSEAADKEAKYSVVLKNTPLVETDNSYTLAIKSQSEDLFTEYPLKERFAVKLGTSPQTKLSES